MKKLFTILLITLAYSAITKAQVGIGSVPKDESILDLTNTNNKYLILPVSNTDPFSVLVDESAVIYYQGNLYMKTPDGIKVFTPWKWDGDSTHYISSPSTASVGIGLVPVTSNYKLQVANSGEAISGGGSQGAVMIGSPAGTHILIDNNEIQSKNSATTPGNLLLQEDGGEVQIRSGLDAGNTTVLTAHGSVDAKGKVKENGKDLIPVGTIVMWKGTTVPDGWALCDGGTYNLEAGGTTTTPNLLDRFIVGADATNGTGVAVGNYSYTNSGGQDSVTLTEEQMPSHDHGMETTGNHSHNINGKKASSIWSGDDGDACLKNNDEPAVHIEPTTTDGNHSHDIYDTGNDKPHENRPPYFALAYIMKL